MTFEEAIRRLREQGLKRTPSRESILRLFASDGRYLSASDVREALAYEHPAMSLDTIYRNLSSFAGLDILEETELGGERKFRMHCDRDGHHHHFICMACGRTEELDLCPMDQVSALLPGSVIEDHKFEVYGRCPACSTGADAELPGSTQEKA
ncbi:Fur family transcriptional regulator [Edaphobacillus lindanitolerans]|uniref:Fur family transcriptional regulator, zinc uptake regulator n=1 Tax=Edaphobacillus lindanitolerans TaxID=550447 RepID=A0A1U7PPF2_9BACI|nr:Fur family transcriptional regulator [Edaphobacillus lindanitolerans]SIT82143.1 Fur family transcriptional regulator, zinc uptake regulator [Edaphobacillus lindanitolerans]